MTVLLYVACLLTFWYKVESSSFVDTDPKQALVAFFGQLFYYLFWMGSDPSYWLGLAPYRPLIGGVVYASLLEYETLVHGKKSNVKNVIARMVLQTTLLSMSSAILSASMAILWMVSVYVARCLCRWSCGMTMYGIRVDQ